MLKYATKRRSILAVIGLSLLICMLAAPLRHDYSTSYSVTDNEFNGPVDPNHAIAIYETTTRIGLPFTWLTLTKTEARAGSAQTSSSTKQADKLLLDLGIWAVCVILIGLVMRLDDALLPPRTRDIFKP